MNACSSDESSGSRFSFIDQRDIIMTDLDAKGLASDCKIVKLIPDYSVVLKSSRVEGSATIRLFMKTENGFGELLIEGPDEAEAVGLLGSNGVSSLLDEPASKLDVDEPALMKSSLEIINHNYFFNIVSVGRHR
ncbi:hypothetical protein JTB14_026842 [Gonioctena quinquepunctata]|nr:hypothetical protein JTB14_026842 [Gonioctena quinquepunctata]